MKTPICGTLLLLWLLPTEASSWLRQGSSRALNGQQGDVKELTSGEIVGPIDFENEKATKLFVLEGIELGDSVQCETDAEEGDIDLFLRFNAPPVLSADGQGGNHACGSIEYNSEEQCIIRKRKETEERVYVLLHAYRPTVNATLTCQVTPTEELVRSVPVQLSLDRDHDALFHMDLEKGEAVECIAWADAPIDDIDLYLSLAEIPNPEEQIYHCRSALSNNRTENCGLPAVPENTTMFVYLDAWGLDVENATLSCMTVKTLKLDQELTVAMQESEERIYRIDLDGPSNISCWANSSSFLELSMGTDDSALQEDQGCHSSGNSTEGQLCRMDLLSDNTVVVKLTCNDTTPYKTVDVQLHCTSNQTSLSFLAQEMAIAKELVAGQP